MTNDIQTQINTLRQQLDDLERLVCGDDGDDCFLCGEPVGNEWCAEDGYPEYVCRDCLNRYDSLVESRIREQRLANALEAIGDAPVVFGAGESVDAINAGMNVLAAWKEQNR